jgi:hypothetical protein
VLPALVAVPPAAPLTFAPAAVPAGPAAEPIRAPAAVASPREIVETATPRATEEANPPPVPYEPKAQPMTLKGVFHMSQRSTTPARTLKIGISPALPKTSSGALMIQEPTVSSRE